MTRLLRSHRLRCQSQRGFTVIELLVVMVILPLIIGAIAEALIVSFNSESSTNNRLSGAVNNALLSAYFVRDVHGASIVTTSDNSGQAVFNSTSPQVCSPGTGTLGLALFHPPSGSSPALDVAYWLEGTGSTTELDRYACTYSSTAFTSTSPTKVAVGQPPSGTATVGAVGQLQFQTSPDIAPIQFQDAAAGGWTSVMSMTTVATPVSPLSSTTSLTVGDTAGFTVGSNGGTVCAPTTLQTTYTGCTGATITVETTLGSEQVTCTGMTLTSFTTCSGGGSGGVAVGAVVTQSSVTAVQLALTQPDGTYKYNLSASPYTGLPGLFASGTTPTLLTLGTTGINPINGGGGALCPNSTVKANICVETGGVLVDNGGTIFCNGAGPHDYIYTYGQGGIDSVAPPGDSTCNGVNVGPAGTFLLPLAQQLPPCLSNSLISALGTGSTSGGISTPGVYTTTRPSGQLEPGLYVIEDGIGSNTGMVPYSAGDKYYHGFDMSTGQYGNGNPDQKAGVLFYIPGPGPYSGCITDSSSLGLQSAQISGLVPMDSTQSTDYFPGVNGGAPNASLNDVWLWQDATNVPTNTAHPSQDALRFSVTGSTQGGLAYLPSGQVVYSGNSNFVTGSVVAEALILSGTDQLVLTGQ